MTKVNDWVTSGDCAQQLGIGENTLRQWRMQARGPAYHKQGHRVLYKQADIDKFLAGNRVEAGQ